jgi:hypothetical protein
VECQVFRSKLLEGYADVRDSCNPQPNDFPLAWDQSEYSLAASALEAVLDFDPFAPRPAPATTPLVSSNNSPDSSLQPKTIGYIQHGGSYVFMCSRPACRNKSFGRWADLKRHIEAFHEVKDNVLWCPVSTCKRSEAFGDKPFPTTRKDKLMEHIRKMHC